MSTSREQVRPVYSASSGKRSGNGSGARRRSGKKRRGNARAWFRLFLLLVVLGAAGFGIWKGGSALLGKKSGDAGLAAKPSGTQAVAAASSGGSGSAAPAILPPLTEDGILMTELKDGVYRYARDGVTYLRISGQDMILCNKEYTVPEDYGDGLTSACETAIGDMFSTAAQDGIDLSVGSGYRSYSLQQQIHANCVSAYGDEYANTVSAEAGHSEHQLGLAIDVQGTHGGYLQTAFEDTPEFAWLQQHAVEYGFILRYPKDKTWATGYAYEPWHYRYVGSALAQILTQSGLTVEEYAGLTWKSGPDAA